MICDLAAQSLGAIVYGIYPTASVAEVEYQMRDGGASIFIAEDQEYVDKILPLADRLPALRAIIVIDDSAMFGYDHPKLRRYRRAVEPRASPISTGSKRRWPASSRPIRPSSSTPLARPAIRKARWSPTATISRRPRRWPTTIRRCRQAPPHGDLSAALPCARPRRRHHAAADVAAGAAFRRETPRTCRDAVRDRADRAVHRAALSAEVRIADSGRR